MSTDRRRLALYILCGGLLMIVLDATIFNVALPSIQEDLGFSQLGAVSVALLAGFVGRQARTETPVIPLRLFRSNKVVGANLTMALMVAGFSGLFFLGALYLQGILGYSPLEVGLAFLPACLVIGWLSLGYAEKLIMGIGPRRALLGGLVASGAGLALFARAPVDGDYLTDVLAVPINTTMQVGGALGLAVLATLASRHSDAPRADGEPLNAALNSGYRLAYLVGAACVAAAILAALLVLKPALPMAGVERERVLDAGSLGER